MEGSEGFGSWMEGFSPESYQEDSRYMGTRCLVSFWLWATSITECARDRKRIAGLPTYMSFLVRLAIVSFSALTLATTSSGKSRRRARLPLMDTFKVRMTEG
jgi:hypothetical protein